MEQGARGGRGIGGELRSMNSVNHNMFRENYDFDEITQGELTLDYEITEPKCNGIQIMQIQRPRKNMNPSFFIPENCKHAIAPEGLSPLSPRHSPQLLTNSNKTYSPRVYQRQAKIKINSLDFKRNSDFSLKINNTCQETSKQAASGEQKILNADAIQKL